jgi:hypothetical protein
LQRNVSRLAAVCVVATLALAGCERRPEAKPSPPPPPAETPPVIPAPPLPPPPLGRSELLTALDTARFAYAAGRPDPEQSLAGRRFSIREAFGCGGAPAAQAEDGVAGWRWGPKEQTIEISLTPIDWTSQLVVGEDAARWEAAEGYWITLPWLRTEDCPARRAPAAAPPAPAPAATPAPAKAPSKPPAPAKTPTPAAATTPAAPAAAAPAPPVRRTDGLAAVFEREGSRVGRRAGRAFSLTLRDELTPPPAGYRLVLEGRFSAFASGRAIRCQAQSPDERPVCLAAAIVDRVAIESADGKLLKEWRLG